jgi:long-chain acyl-CoA synthetase
LILKECNAIGKKNGFKTMELLEAVVLTPDEWTPESGLVTAAQKIQRSKIAKKFEVEIKVLYSSRFVLKSSC